ncbi:MAG TPA: beta-ketoacyl-[acyl-carrier-protein] synthase family protein [Hyphomicrobiaceae bacterium]|nr:beta-ketoacyl-[acyl-carrier-protein] synthase family protein [Hyphomicrobiaceae bacterium]
MVRIAVTGMAINTSIGDRLDDFLDGLLNGRSSITAWKGFETDNIYSKIGGDLSDYDVRSKLEDLRPKLSNEIYERLRPFVRRAPWSTKLSVLVAADAWQDAGLVDAAPDPHAVSAIVGGHNLNSQYTRTNNKIFEDEPDYVDAMYALHSLDTDHVGSISEILQVKGAIYTVGAACASANTAIRCAVDEIRHHGCRVAVVVGAALDFAPVDLHAMALMGAISFQSFNDEPERASRPYDVDREGFIPSHGAAAIVLEDMASAQARGARAYAELVGVEARSDGNHLPNPSEDGQEAAMRAALAAAGIAPELVGYISAHATSTPLGDVTEIRSIKRVFGDHAKTLVLNAPKSLLGHTCWAAPVVEAVAAILQMRAGIIHPSVNIDHLDSEVDLDVCANEARSQSFEYFMNNSFGFGGINCVSVFKRVDE